MVFAAIRAQRGKFRLADLERARPGVGREWIRKLLVDLRGFGKVACRGKGLAARWRVNSGSSLKAWRSTSISEAGIRIRPGQSADRGSMPHECDRFP